jgi:hypothetical protein
MGRNNYGKETEEIGSKAYDLHSCFGRVQIYEGTRSILKFYSQEDVGEVSVISVISGLNGGAREFCSLRGCLAAKIRSYQRSVTDRLSRNAGNYHSTLRNIVEGRRRYL